MFNPFEASCLRYVEYTSHPQVNNGQPLPVFEPVKPEAHPSINTLDGWNALSDAQNRRAFVSANGREPESRDELYTWVLKCG